MGGLAQGGVRRKGVGVVDYCARAVIHLAGHSVALKV